MSNNKLRLKHLVSVHNGYGFPVEFQGDKGTIPFYKVSDMNTIGNEKYLVNSNNYVTEELCKSKNWKLVPAGSIILPKIGAALLTNKRRMTSQPCLIDNNCCALIPVDMNQGEWIYNSVLNIDSGDFCQSGAVPALKMGDFLLSEISLPNDRENLLITLESKLSLVDSSIGNLTQKLHHLEEYKTALIHNAVTKGLDANGNEITNSEWKSRSVKSLFHTATRGKNCTYSDNDNENLIITQSCLLQDNTLDVSKGKFEVNSPSGEKFHLSNGDILISSSGVKNTIGKVAYIEGINKTTIANWDVMRLCTNTDMHSKYTYYLLITMRNHIKEYCLRGATGQEHLIADFFNESTVCVPKVADQETISKFLDIEVTNLNIIKKKINKKIALLLEYKKSLINEAVSGQ